MYKRLFIIFSACFVIAVALGAVATTILIRHYHIPANPKSLIILPLLFFLTFMGLLFRFWRWHYFLRRSGIRIPTRKSLGIYLSGFSQTVIPLFVGEIALKAILVKRQSNTPLEPTILIVTYERLLDLMTLSIFAIPYFLIYHPHRHLWIALPIILVVLLTLSPVRKALWILMSSLLGTIIHLLIPNHKSPDHHYPPSITSARITATALAFSICSWLAVASILPLTATFLGGNITWIQGSGTFALSAIIGGASLSPGGVGITGSLIAQSLIQTGMPSSSAGMVGILTRLSTFGLVTGLGIIALAIYLWRNRSKQTATAHRTFAGYDHQFAPDARNHYIEKKAIRMDISLQQTTAKNTSHSRLILDLGCGPGWYLPVLTDSSSKVIGIDSSLPQLILAKKNLPDATLLAGDICSIPIKNNRLDVAYAINIFHHLPTAQSQHQALREIHRILKPGGVLMLHEMNVTNPLFRFYLGYILPLFNRVDQGTEIWIEPPSLTNFAGLKLLHIEYFTFLPDFLPAWLIKYLRGVELVLERSPLRKLSAHFMAFLQK